MRYKRRDCPAHKPHTADAGSRHREGHRVTYFWSLALAACTLCLALSACAPDAYLSDVRFRIVAKDSGEPLGNRALDIYTFVYDVQYDSKDAPWYIASVTTDAEGVFSLDLSRMDVGHIVVQPGKPYNIVRFERASDLGHTGSTGHVRVVRTRPGGTRVESNAIYDLERHTVQTIPVSGDAWEEPYTEILLVAPAYEPSRSIK
jgi:hypothetical protein